MTVQNAFGNRLIDPQLIDPGVQSSLVKALVSVGANGRISYVPRGATGQILGLDGNGDYVWVGSVAPTGNAGGSLTGTYPNPLIATNAVNFSMLQNINTAAFLGRDSAGSGNVEVLTVPQSRSLLGLGSAALKNSGNAVGEHPLVEAGGKLNPSIIPALPSNNPVRVVASQSAMLALSGVLVNDKVVIQNSGNTDENATWVLAQTPSNTIANWIKVSDNSIRGEEITAGTISTDRLGSGSSDSTAVLTRSGWSLPTPGNAPYIEVTSATQTLENNKVYRVNRTSKVTLTLPSSAALGDRITILGGNTGGYSVAQNAGQTVRFLNQVTSSGTPGRVDTDIPGVGIVDPYGTLCLVCIEANTKFQVLSSTGTFDIV
jgi:hypothetical protein